MPGTGLEICEISKDFERKKGFYFDFIWPRARYWKTFLIGTSRLRPGDSDPKVVTVILANMIGYDVLFIFPIEQPGPFWRITYETCFTLIKEYLFIQDIK